jgi:hypothetical protein
MIKCASMINVLQEKLGPNTFKFVASRNRQTGKWEGRGLLYTNDHYIYTQALGLNGMQLGDRRIKVVDKSMEGN